MQGMEKLFIARFLLQLFVAELFFCSNPDLREKALTGPQTDTDELVFSEPSAEGVRLLGKRACP